MTTWYRSRLLLAAALALASPVLAQSISVKDATGTPITIRVPNANGRAAAASSAPITVSTEDLAAINSLLKPGQSILLGGPLPAFASTPTFNLGTAPSLTISNFPTTPPTGAALDATLATLNGKIDTLNTKVDVLHTDNGYTPPALPPLSAGTAAIGSITNPAFGITGTATTAAPTYANGAAATASFDTTGALRTTGSSSGSAPTGTAGSPNPAVTTVQGISGGTPQPTVLTTGAATIGTVNLGTLNGAATAANQTAMTAALSSVGVASIVNPADVGSTPTLGTGTVGTFAQFATAGAGTVAVEVTNLPAGAVLNIQKVVGTTVYTSSAIPAGVGNASTSTISANGVYHLIAGGAAYVRLTVATAATGTANLTWLGTAGAELVGVRQSTPLNLYASTVTDSRINDGAGNLLGVQYAAINASAAGNNTVVAAVTGKRIKVLGFFAISAANNTIVWQDGATNTMTGALPFLANQGQNAATTAYGLFATSAGNALVLNLSVASPVTGYLSFVAY